MPSPSEGLRHLDAFASKKRVARFVPTGVPSVINVTHASPQKSLQSEPDLGTSSPCSQRRELQPGVSFMFDVSTLSGLTSFYQLNLGYLQSAFERLRSLPLEAELKAHVSKSLEDVQSAAVARLDAAKAKNTDEKGNRPAVLIDRQLDRAIGSLTRTIDAFVGLQDDASLIANAEDFLHLLFPEGVAAVVNATIVDELSSVDALLEVARRKEHVKLVAQMGLEPSLTRIGALADKLRAELNREKALNTFTGSEMKAAIAKGNEALAQYIFRVGGKYWSNSKEHVAGRRRFLGPLAQLHEELAELYRNRKQVPETPIAPAPDDGR